MTRRPAVLLGAFLLLVQFLLAPGYVDNVGSRIVLRTAEQLLDHGSWSLGDVEGTYMASPEYSARGADGSHQMKFGAGNAILALPAIALGRTLLEPFGLDRHKAGEAAASLMSGVWFALAGVLLFRIARRQQAPRAALATTLLWAFATYALVYGRSSYLETPLTVALLLAFDAALSLRAGGGARAAVVLGVACVAVLWIKVAALALLLGLLPVVWARAARPRLGVAAGVFVLGAAALAAVNDTRFGNPFATGYASSLRFDNPLFAGIADLLVSQRGGLFLYAPVLVLAIPGTAALARRDASFAVGIVGALVVALPLYATFFSPFGGDAWGPRYLVPNGALLAVPAGLAAERLYAAARLRRAALCALVAFSAAVQVPPALVSFREVWSRRASRAGDDAVAPQRVLAEVLAEKVRAGWTLDLWPVRVGEGFPGRAGLAWAAWAVVAVGAGVCGYGAVRAVREPV